MFLSLHGVAASRKRSSGPPPAGFRYFRLLVTKAGAGIRCQVQDMLFQGDPGGSFPPTMTSNSVPAPYVASVTNAATGQAYYLFTPALGFWRSSSAPSVAYPVWCALDCGTTKRPTALWISTNSATMYPRDFLVQGSDDNLNWTTLATVVGNTALSTTVPLSYP